MKKPKLLIALLLGITIVGSLTACSKKDDSTTNGSGTTPSGKEHKLKLTYSNLGLDKSQMNVGGGFRVTVDKTPVMLGGTVEPTYYIQQQDHQAPIVYPDVLTIRGNTLTLEVGLYNVYGTKAQPKNINGGNVTLANYSYLGVQATIDGVDLSQQAAVVGLNASGGLTFDNGVNPTKTVTIDLTKL